MNGCSFPLADSDYTNPTHQENTMTDNIQTLTEDQLKITDSFVAGMHKETQL